MMNRPMPVKSVSITIDGVEHHGTYYVQGSFVCVHSDLGNKLTHVGRSPPEAIAKLLLAELVRGR
jgi:hypothetical protein